MAIGPTNVGGAGLDFSIEGYTQYPEKAKENTIGVITETPISDYIITPVPPAHQEGRVWVNTATPSLVGIQIVKRKPIYVYPGLVRQSISGKWQAKDFQVWQNGKWNKGWLALFDNGNENVPLTGGWVADGYARKENSGGNLTAVFTGHVKAWVHTQSPIDLTNLKTIHAYCGYTPGDGECSFYLDRRATPQDSYDRGRYLSANGWYDINVADLSGSYYIGIRGENNTIRFANNGDRPAIYLE